MYISNPKALRDLKKSIKELELRLEELIIKANDKDFFEKIDLRDNLACSLYIKKKKLNNMQKRKEFVGYQNVFLTRENK